MLLRNAARRLFIVGIRPFSSKSGGVLVVSIGNPEPQYKNTRHNVGHWILEELHKSNFPVEFGPWKDNETFGGAVSFSKDGLVVLVRSLGSYMNTQGKPVSKIVQSYAKEKTLLVVHDDLQKDVGRLQVRLPGTSARGHNGLKSIDQSIGKLYSKVSIGIGRPDKKPNVTDYVLSKFTLSEQAQLEKTVEGLGNIIHDIATRE